MFHPTAKTERGSGDVTFAVSSAFFVTFLLFFIDEGFYNFHWMLELRNWAAFLLYFCVLLFVQITARLIFFARLPDLYRDSTSFAVGVPVGLYLLFYGL